MAAALGFDRSIEQSNGAEGGSTVVKATIACIPTEGKLEQGMKGDGEF